jgi:hypothetical protein
VSETATDHIAAVRSAGPAGRSRRPGSRSQLAQWAITGVLAVAVLAYAVWFVIRLHLNITSLLWNSDYASGYVLPETVARFGSGGHTVISTTGAWLPLWFGLLTARLPLHRELWEITPTVLFLVSAALVGWSVSLVSSRRAGLYAAVIVATASPFALAVFMAPVAHNTVYPMTALLPVYLLWQLRHEAQSRRVRFGVPLAMALLLGTTISSDKLLIVTGAVPMAIVAVLAILQRGRGTRLWGVWTLATLVMAAPVSIVTSAVMKAEGYQITPPPLQLTPLSQVGAHVRLMATGLRDLFNGYLGVRYPGTLHALLGTLCTMLLIASLCVLVWVGLRNLVVLFRGGAGSAEAIVRPLHVTYWFTSAVAVCAAFLFTNASGVGNSTHESYYLTLVFSVAAVVALFAPTPNPRTRFEWLRWVIPLGLAVFAIAGIVGLKREYITITYRSPIAADVAMIIHLAHQNDATTGYAGYWDASNVTWNTRERVEVRPIEQCARTHGAPICPFFLMRSPYWYIPRQRRTFLLVDPNELYVTSLPPGLGPPLAKYQLGSVTMYVYRYDIASRLGRPALP